MNNPSFNHPELFSIGDLSERTGVNSVTLRAWERRYGLLKPARTEKGHRLYSDNDVERVVQIFALIERGVPLRKIRGLLDNTDEQLTHFEQEEDAKQLQSELLAQLEQCHLVKLSSTLQDMFQQYPAVWCNSQVVQPLFTLLTNHPFAVVLAELLQAEIMRFAARYLPVSASRKKHTTMQVMGGMPTAPWRAVMLTLELQERQYLCQWLPGAFSLLAIEQFISLQPDLPLLYCLDGVLNDKQEQQLQHLLSNSPNLWLQGTAVELAFAEHERVLRSASDLPLLKQK